MSDYVRQLQEILKIAQESFTSRPNGLLVPAERTRYGRSLIEDQRRVAHNLDHLRSFKQSLADGYYFGVDPAASHEDFQTQVMGEFATPENTLYSKKQLRDLAEQWKTKPRTTHYVLKGFAVWQDASDQLILLNEKLPPDPAWRRVCYRDSFQGQALTVMDTPPPTPVPVKTSDLASASSTASLWQIDQY